jgi:hypothetical protein
MRNASARLAAFLASPWRAVPVLGVAQILAWGAMFFPPVLTVPVIAAERGWSTAFGMAGFSTALLVAGLASPRMGKLVDRHGGHVVMPAGSLIGAAGLTLLVLTESHAGWLIAWSIVGVAMAAALYDASFATLGRIFGAAARQPITWLTLVSGFASSISWPTTHALLDVIGWRATYLIYAAVLAVIVAPLAALGLPRTRAAAEPAPAAGAKAPPRVVPASGLPFFLVAAAFAGFAFVHAGMGAHVLTIFNRMGLELGTAVALGAMAGPVQILVRVFEISVGRGRLHPLWMARWAVLLLLAAFAALGVLGVSAVSVGLFFFLYGLCNGVFTIARGALPLALFGAAGYGHVIGRLALPFLVMQAVAPIALALVIERISDPAALAALALFAAISLACFFLLSRP